MDIAEDGPKGLEMFTRATTTSSSSTRRCRGSPGLEVIRELKQRGPLPPILMISALGSEEVAVEALKLGAMDYIIKDPGAGFLEQLPADRSTTS